MKHHEHLINKEPTFVLIIYMWPSCSGHLRQRKSGILIRLEDLSCYIIMNLFAFHYITNYTLSSYQDCSLSFEVGLQDTHTIQIDVWCSVHNRDWGKKCCQMSFHTAIRTPPSPQGHELSQYCCSLSEMSVTQRGWKPQRSVASSIHSTCVMPLLGCGWGS